ncbi:beta-galactosidase GalA [Carboxylicivirga caseinilyticus]|uniref:beta-galactosidase GalA n=1 Tax=Carboxylicivirga caseinilyticus TaxID=3417572 RepID=UPI003D3362A4|nr:DUF4982 domain-containing protein [Marinilabiliaceae bacterium A049]
MSLNRKTVLLLGLLVLIPSVYAQVVRERINFDKDWKFTYGHPTDFEKDFNTGTSYFTYLAKAGFGDGAAAVSFDDRTWRQLNIPHDWAVEVPFDAKGSHSHGYKAVGRNFPDVSVGWYRKHFTIDEKDFGNQIFIDFDGVSRDAMVWVNGHYLGNESSGYQSFGYNITDLLNYGGENVVAVRADVTIEEGWYYEGAGIYRHVWLRKTSPLHVQKDGTFVYADIDADKANVTVKTEIENRGIDSSIFVVSQQVINAEGKVLAEAKSEENTLAAMAKGEVDLSMVVSNPHLWSLEDPYLHTVITQILVDGNVVDEYKTRTGFRTVYFDADKGFFLNGKHVKLKGTNNHQDHAGVGCAMPDELIRWRLQQLKNFGSNAYRSSHNPATPELLSMCDEMGILVIDENRLMGSHQEAFDEVERLIRRDRNHPSIFVWSMGNEEWGIECNVLGERITTTMQNFARTIDPTRPMNTAVSGGCNQGVSAAVEVMGYNYLGQWDTDKHHELFPNQPSMGTEEGSTWATRGIYFDDPEKHYMRAYDHLPRPTWETIETSWKHYAERDYLAGMFIWTGFDYRGEPTPYAWPSITSYFGMMDLCGFPKDNVFYLKSWWGNEPVLHLLPHWNWTGKEGDTIQVWAYSNCEEVELFLNGKTQGRKSMEVNGHLEWPVVYQPGKLKAVGYANGEKIMEEIVETTTDPYKIELAGHKTMLKNCANDVSVVTVKVLDKKGRAVPVADNLIEFTLEGPGKLIGVGNGNPTSLEKDKFIDDYKVIQTPKIRKYDLGEIEVDLPEAATAILEKDSKNKMMVTEFDLSKEDVTNGQFIWYSKKVGDNLQAYLNGVNIQPIEGDLDNMAVFKIDNSLLKEGTNNLVLVGLPLAPPNQWDEPNKHLGDIQMVKGADQWKRKLFNGLAQVIVQPDERGAGEIILNATSNGLKGTKLIITVE